MDIQNIFEKEGSIDMVDNRIPEVDVDQLINQVETIQADESVTKVQVDLNHHKSMLVGNKRKVRLPSWNGSLGVTIPRIVGGDADKFKCGR